METAGPQVSVKTQQESVRRGESVTLRCEAEGDAPLDLSWRARDSRVDPNYDVRFVSKLIKPPLLFPSLLCACCWAFVAANDRRGRHLDLPSIFPSIDAARLQSRPCNAALIKRLVSTLESRNFPFKITGTDEKKERSHVRRAFNPPPPPLEAFLEGFIRYTRSVPLRGACDRASGRGEGEEGREVSTEHFPNNAALLRYEIIPASSLAR